MAWRQSLKIGDKIEAIKLKNIGMYRLSAWSTAVITGYYNEEEDNFIVQFENEVGVVQQIMNRYGTLIAKVGTFDDDNQWRIDLKVGDVFDCLDTENVWYKSTALEIRNVDQGDGRMAKQVYVGFRIFDDEEGHKVDEDGRKFLGWSSRYDEWRNIYCVTVQKFRSMVKHYKVAGRNSMNYDQMIDDLNDVIYNTKQRKVWTIYRQNFFANLKCITDYLNEFG